MTNSIIAGVVKRQRDREARAAAAAGADPAASAAASDAKLFDDLRALGISPERARAISARNNKTSSWLAALGLGTGVGAAALSAPDDANAGESRTPPPGAVQVRSGINSVYYVPAGANERAPSFDARQLEAMGPDNPNLVLARSQDGGGVILERQGNGLIYRGRAWLAPSPLSQDISPPHSRSVLPVLAPILGGIVGGGIGRRVGARRGQPLLGQAVGSAAGGAFGGGAYGLTTPEADAAELAGYGTMFGPAASASGSLIREGARRVAGITPELPRGVIRMPRSGARGAPTPAIGQGREIGPLDEATLNAELRLGRGQREPAAERRRRLGSSVPAEERIARGDDERGSFVRHLRGFGRFRLQNMAREAGVEPSGTLTQVAQRITDATRQNPQLLQRLRRLYPYLGIAGLGAATNQDSGEAAQQ